MSERISHDETLGAAPEDERSGVEARTSAPALAETALEVAKTEAGAATSATPSPAGTGDASLTGTDDGWQGDRPAPRIVPYGDEEEEDVLLGQTLSGLYRVESQIGAGGMGTVYLAVHIHLERPFAVKVLADTVATNQEAVQRLLQEARTASSIDHENIVDVVSFDTTADGRVFIVMEFLEGTSLGDLIERSGAIEIERVLPIAVQVCRALEAAHERGVVHRDLKPDNVFLVKHRSGADFVKVLDFGISKVQTAEAEQVRMTKTGQLVGTPLYMSPEQARGDTDIDLRADIYAVGIMLHEMITGRPPFDGSNYFQLLWKHGNETPPPMRDRMPSVPDALEAVVQKALAKKREDRYQSMLELEEALIAALPDLATTPLHLMSLPPRASDPRGSNPSNPRLSDPSPPEPASTASDSAPEASTPNEVISRESDPTVVTKPSPMLYIGGAIFGLAMLAIGAMALGGPDDPPPPPATRVGQPPENTVTPMTTMASAMENSESAMEEPLPEVPRERVIEIRSSPAGAAIFDGETLLGTAPGPIRVLAGESHELRLELEGHADTPLTVTPDSPESLEVTLEPTPSTMRVRGTMRPGSTMMSGAPSGMYDF